MADDRDAVDRAAYEATRNPLHVWSGIGRYAADEPLPIWIRRYLLKTTRELLQLQLDNTITPTEAQERTARALGIVSQGRNCFEEIRQLREEGFGVTLYDLGAATALELADATGINPNGHPQDRVRSFRRRVAKVRRTRPQ